MDYLPWPKSIGVIREEQQAERRSKPFDHGGVRLDFGLHGSAALEEVEGQGGAGRSEQRLEWKFPVQEDVEGTYIRQCQFSAHCLSD